MAFLGTSKWAFGLCITGQVLMVVDGITLVSSSLVNAGFDVYAL
jgi:hypothetical protein